MLIYRPIEVLISVLYDYNTLTTITAVMRHMIKAYHKQLFYKLTAYGSVIRTNIKHDHGN